MGLLNKHTKERTISFSFFYLKYFAALFMEILLIVVCAIFTFLVMVACNMIYPANQAEQQASEAAGTLSDAAVIDESMIPELCQYVLFDKNGRVLAATIPEKDLPSAWQAADKGAPLQAGSYFSQRFFKVIPRADGFCVLRYAIVTQYRSVILRKYLPSPLILIGSVALFLVFLCILYTAIRFGSDLRKKLNPLILASDKIKHQELDFHIPDSEILEISAVLTSMEQMRAALKESLEQQWQFEQEKSGQISALAHDLKTPLTLIRGNAELLSDTGPDTEQTGYLAAILDSAMQMQDYIQTLIQTARSQSIHPMQMQEVSLACFLQDIRKECNSLCSIYKQELQWDCRPQTALFMAEPVSFQRAICNIIVNAVEHTPEGGRIVIRLLEQKNRLVFLIEDSGSGFSKEALRHATEPFFMDEKSRSSKFHFGIGLYAADQIIRQHGGSMVLKAAETTCGAQVRVEIPLGGTSLISDGKT